MTAITAARSSLDAGPARGRRAGLAGALRSEFTKLRSVRSTYWALLLLVLAGIAWSVANCAGEAAHWAQLPPGQRAFDATQDSVVALALLGQLVVVVLGTLAITSEYSTGMIRTSLTVLPRRGVLFTAKAIVLAAVTLAVALATSLAAFFTGQYLPRSTHQAATLGQPDVLRAVLATALYVVLSGLFSLGLGPMLRSTAGALTAAYGLLFLIPQLAKALPSQWYADSVRWLPGGDVINAITSTERQLPQHVFSAWGEFAVFGGYTAIVLAAGRCCSAAVTPNWKAGKETPMLSHRPAARLGLAGALAGTGCAASAASTGATAAAPSHTAHLMVYSINSDGPDFQAIVTGAIGDYGPAQTVFGNGRVDPSHTHDLELKLTRGSFKLSIAGLDKKFTAVTSHEPIYPRTCSDYMTASAPMPVVPGSGTGAYRGISGRFTVTITGDEVERTPCQPDAGFRWQALVLRGPGRAWSGKELLSASRRAAALAVLTPREREVLALIAQGRSNAPIADTFTISPRVVEKHVASIFAKLGLPPSQQDNRRVLAAIKYLES